MLYFLHCGMSRFRQIRQTILALGIRLDRRKGRDPTAMSEQVDASHGDGMGTIGQPLHECSLTLGGKLLATLDEFNHLFHQPVVLTFKKALNHCAIKAFGQYIDQLLKSSECKR